MILLHGEFAGVFAVEDSALENGRKVFGILSDFNLNFGNWEKSGERRQGAWRGSSGNWELRQN